jgi:hypothetical protein
MSCEAWINPRAGAHYPSAAGRKSVSMGRASRRAPCEPGCIGGRPVTDFRSSALVSSDLSVRSSSGSSDTLVPSVDRLTFRPRHGTLSIPSSGHSTFFEIRQLDLSLAHLGHLPGTRNLLDVRAGPLEPEAPASAEAVTPRWQVEKVAGFLLRRTPTALCSGKYAYILFKSESFHHVSGKFGYIPCLVRKQDQGADRPPLGVPRDHRAPGRSRRRDPVRPRRSASPGRPTGSGPLSDDKRAPTTRGLRRQEGSDDKRRVAAAPRLRPWKRARPY